MDGAKTMKGDLTILGIDPGKTTGLGFVKDGKVLNLMSVDFWCCIDEINVLVAKTEPYLIVIEVPKTDHVWQPKAKRGNLAKSIAVDVGRVVNQGELIADYCKRNGINHITKNPQGKVNADLFDKVTGWNKQSNPHTRDAAMLAFGVSRVDLINKYAK
jgi:hypothetical protein